MRYDGTIWSSRSGHFTTIGQSNSNLMFFEIEIDFVVGLTVMGGHGQLINKCNYKKRVNRLIKS